MKKKLSDHLTEKKIINLLLKKLNFNKKGTFNFENDAAYLSLAKNYKTIVTTDSITENIDFFYNDPPESIAQKFLDVNLKFMGHVPASQRIRNSIISRRPIMSKHNKNSDTIAFDDLSMGIPSLKINKTGTIKFFGN